MNQASPPDRFDSVWDAISYTAEVAANLRLLSGLMDKITALINSEGGSRQPLRGDAELVRGRLTRFSLHALVNFAAKTGAAGACGHGGGFDWIKAANQVLDVSITLCGVGVSNVNLFSIILMYENFCLWVYRLKGRHRLLCLLVSRS